MLNRARMLAASFSADTVLATPQGARTADSLKPGDYVITMDNGPRRLAWTGDVAPERCRGVAPVRVETGALCNETPLILAPEHHVIVRVAGEELLLPIRALVGQPGIDFAPGRHLRFRHLLFDRHEIVFAQGAAVESLLPSEPVMRAMSLRARSEIMDHLPGLTGKPEWSAARRRIRVGAWRRANLELRTPGARFDDILRVVA
ncbi:Hint domain-containing protein [Litorisediminicola beolgyonensis]|uniref:Hint domain-containing protein n=1 Tax=Litorisediminicola beolgyonensis TaxID=1173614 RepID=A0ABW3ZF21_9RHOB